MPNAETPLLMSLKGASAAGKSSLRPMLNEVMSDHGMAAEGYGTYLRHVDTLFMYFVVTPPNATVERGWERGLRTGRYKAVEDYLDNSVPKGTFPKMDLARLQT